MDPKRKRHIEVTQPDGKRTKFDPHLSVANICATADYKCYQDIDLLQVALTFKNVEYNPNFAACLLRRRDRVEHCMVVLLLFRSGKVNIVGVKSEERALYWLTYLRRELHRLLNITYRAPLQMDVSMITCRSSIMGDKPCTLDVRSFYDDHMHLSVWEPEIFPGLKFSPFNNKITILGFESSEFVITGSKTLRDSHRAAVCFQDLARQHLKKWHPNEMTAPSQ